MKNWGNSLISPPLSAPSQTQLCPVEARRWDVEDRRSEPPFSSLSGATSRCCGETEGVAQREAANDGGSRRLSRHPPSQAALPSCFDAA